MVGPPKIKKIKIKDELGGIVGPVSMLGMWNHTGNVVFPIREVVVISGRERISKIIRCLFLIRDAPRLHSLVWSSRV